MVQDIAYHPGLGLSYHVSICFTVLCYSVYAPSSNLRLNLHHANCDGIRECLSAIDWYSELSSLNVTDVWNYFYDVFNNATKSNIPVSHVTYKNISRLTIVSREAKKKQQYATNE